MLDEEIAQAIHESAISSNAERIVFWDGHELIRVSVNAQDIYRTIVTRSPVKVKLQRRSDNAWVDIQKYQRLDRVLRSKRDWLKPVRTGQLDNLSADDLSDFVMWARTSPDRFHNGLTHLVRKTMPEANASGFKVARKCYPVLKGVIELIDDPFLRYAVSQLEVTSSLCAENDSILDPQELNDYIEGIHFTVSGAESDIVQLLWKGKIESLTDRPTAAAHFRQAIDLDEFALINSFYFDTGAHSYYTSETIDNAKVSQIEPFETIYGKIVGANQAVNCSVDPNFLRIYGARLLLLAQQVPEVDFIITLCCGRQEALKVAQELVNLSVEISKFNRSGSINNLIINTTTVPGWVENPITFYAAARFFCARELLSDYEYVYTMDIDLEATEHPGPYWNSLKPVSLLAPHTQGFGRLSPWRRILAGNVQMSQRALASGLLDQLCDYLLVGLSAESSWMLDQNALAFVQEMFPDDIADIGKRPFYAFDFKRSWEEKFKKNNS